MGNSIRNGVGMQGKYNVAISHRLLAVSSRSSESRSVADYTDYADYKRDLCIVD